MNGNAVAHHAKLNEVGVASSQHREHHFAALGAFETLEHIFVGEADTSHIFAVHGDDPVARLNAELHAGAAGNRHFDINGVADEVKLHPDAVEAAFELFFHHLHF